MCFAVALIIIGVGAVVQVIAHTARFRDSVVIGRIALIFIAVALPAVIVLGFLILAGFIA